MWHGFFVVSKFNMCPPSATSVPFHPSVTGRTENSLDGLGRRPVQCRLDQWHQESLQGVAHISTIARLLGAVWPARLSLGATGRADGWWCRWVECYYQFFTETCSCQLFVRVRLHTMYRTNFIREFCGCVLVNWLPVINFKCSLQPHQEYYVT